jgi:hypothetical protein
LQALFLDKKPIEKAGPLWDIPIMKLAKVDSRHRILIPELKPGQAFTWENDGNGQITLLEVKPKAKRPAKDRITNVDPLPKEVADRLYRERPDDDGIEGIEGLIGRQAWRE